MNLFNKYLKRSSGEQRFQPNGTGEAAAFIAIDLIKSNGKLMPGFKEMPEDEINAFMSELALRVDRAS
jgi:hypothetical protein